jgi:hypothetical protein
MAEGQATQSFVRNLFVQARPSRRGGGWGGEIGPRSRNLSERLAFARDALGIIQKRFVEITADFRLVAEIHLNSERLNLYLTKIFPIPSIPDDERDECRVPQASEASARRFAEGFGNPKPNRSKSLSALESVRKNWLFIRLIQDAFALNELGIERKAEVVNTGFKCAFYFARTLVDQSQHAVVVSHDVSGESGDSIFARNSGQELEQECPDAVALPLVMYRNSDLGVVGRRVSAITADTQHSFASLERHHPYDGHVIMIVEIDKLLHQFGRQVMQRGEVSVQNCSLRMGAKEFLQQVRVRWLNWSEENVKMPREARSGFILSRVSSEARFFLGSGRVHRKNEGRTRGAP